MRPIAVSDVAEEREGDRVSTHAHNTLVGALQLAHALPYADLPSATLVAAAILLGNRLIPHIPLPFVAVLGSIAASAAFQFSAHGIATIGPVPGGLPAFGLPSVTWSEVLALLPVAATDGCCRDLTSWHRAPAG